MTGDDGLPIDDLYSGGVDIPHNPEDLILMDLKQGQEEIRWTDIEASGELLDALVDAATQFHYILLSQVLLMGRIIDQERDVHAKRLAVFLAAARMRKADEWGRYLGQAQETGTISPALKDYFHSLYEDKQTVSRLIGLLLADVYLFALGDRTQDVGDTMFERLINHDVRRASRNLELAEEYFEDVIPELEEEEREAVLAKAHDYQKQFKPILLAHSDSFKALHQNPETFVTAAQQRANKFYERIGLKP